MKSSKVFYIQNLVFNLPEDFNGTFTDALEMIVDYRRQKETKAKRKLYSANDNNLPLTLDGAFEQLWNNENSKLFLQAGISFYEDNAWADKIENWRCS